MPGFKRSRVGFVARAIASSMVMLAAWTSAQAGQPDGRQGVLSAIGGGRFEALMHNTDAEGRTLFGVKADLEITPVDIGAWRVRLLGASLWEPFLTVWKPLLVDSVDPRTDDLPEGVELEFIVDGAPDMQRLFPHDIPASVFGLLMEVSTMLALCSEAGGLDKVEAPGDSASFSGFELAWTRPYTAPMSRRIVEAGATTLEGVEDGVATVVVRPRSVKWALVRDFGRLQLSVGTEAYEMRVRLDATTGELLAVEVPESVMSFQIAGEVESAVLPEDPEAMVPEEADLMVTKRALSLRPVAEPVEE